MRDIRDDVSALRQRLEEAHKYMHHDEAVERASELETEMGRPDLWDDPENAKAISQEYSQLNDDIKLLVSIDERINDVEMLHSLGAEESDSSVDNEVEASLAALDKEF